MALDPRLCEALDAHVRPHLDAAEVGCAQGIDVLPAQPVGYGARWRFEHREKARYYELWVEPDLFGSVITRVWGGIGSNRGGMKSEPAPADLGQALEKITGRRVQRGYSKREG